MEHQLLFDIFGWIASIGLIFGYLPQAIQTIRTRNTDEYRWYLATRFYHDVHWLLCLRVPRLDARS